MPKILRIINRFNLGGPTYNVAYLTKYLSSNYETLLVGGPEEAGEDSSLFITDKLGIQPLIIPELNRNIRFGNDYVAYKKLKALMRDFKPDIVHTHASKAGAVGRLAAIHAGVPHIVHTFHGHVFHSYFGNLKTSIYKNIERYLAARSSAIVAISDLQKHELSAVHGICPADKITVVPLGFDLSRFFEGGAEKRTSFRQQYGLGDNEVAIGIIGRLAPVKNHRLFLEAIQALVANSSKPFRAFIIGDGETRAETEQLAQSLGLSYSAQEKEKVQVTFTSWITDIDRALAGLDLVCLTSLNEGTPVSLIEAQAAGRYTVSTDVGGIRDILHADNGTLAALSDKAAYFNGLKAAVESEELRARVHETGPAWVRERFHYSRLVHDMEQLYNKLLSTNKSR